MHSQGKLGIVGLTALVFGLMVGLGIFNLPQNMASVAAPASVALAWGITALGILPLVIAFKWLSDNYPQYNAGIYQYAQAGFGNFIGFNIAWGYWLCAACSNVVFAVMLNDSIGAIFPVMLKHSWETVVFCSVLIWTMYFIVAQGIKTAAFINTFLSVIKVIMLLFIIIVFIMFFKLNLFDADIWGTGTNLGSPLTQIKETMMITLFCFFGVEGAVMMSARAKRISDIGKAGIIGFFIALLLYLAVSLLCFGLLEQAEIAQLPNPSIAYILRATCGEWAYWFVITAIILSLLGGWVAWTLVVAQLPLEAAKVGILPRAFLRLNRHSVPTFGLMASSVAMELFLLLVIFADDAYLASLRITGLMIIPSYFFSGLFMTKVAKGFKAKSIAWIATLFCLWMAYAGGIIDMLMTSFFYLAGIGFYVVARKEDKNSTCIFTSREKFILAFLIIASVASVLILI